MKTHIFAFLFSLFFHMKLFLHIFPFPFLCRSLDEYVHELVEFSDVDVVVAAVFVVVAGLMRTKCVKQDFKNLQIS